jgi:hypothetical protein
MKIIREKDEARFPYVVRETSYYISFEKYNNDQNTYKP